MGVPKFFRWLTERFPQINVRISEGRRKTDYVDNFYLDMNGIIHQCTHGDEIGPGEDLSEDQMVERIFAYTERLIKIARPRKVLYLAIDGVAPRAKMNQQRSRRYRVPREMKQQALRDLANQTARRGRHREESVNGQRVDEDEVLGPPPSPPPFDSNCITPGTAFLQNLGERYKRWIEEKMATDPDWMDGPTVIFSGADVPGEGEHKIMDYIREHRRNSTDPAETRHCMYGLDADLIMLGMITHEKHFSLLRERQKFQRGRFAPRGRGGRGRGRGRGRRDEPEPPRGIVNLDNQVQAQADDADFVFLELELLRQCLSGTMRPELAAEELGFEWEVERAVDDFVFLCMLVGNDFLPGLPHLDVADGALNTMMRTYTDMLPGLGGFITDKSQVHMPRFEAFMRTLSSNEAYLVSKKQLRDAEDRQKVADASPGEYKRRYYLQKLGIHPNDRQGRTSVVLSYLEGLSWCLAYYHEGCCSWNWYFPDFYAPLATDLVDLDSYEISLELGEPFPPLAQLLSVLPPQSAALVPSPYQELMLSVTSPIHDAFPVDFVLDANGKRAEWEAIALLPFIDEVRLLAAVSAPSVTSRLTESELARNVRQYDSYFEPQGQAGAA